MKLELTHDELEIFIHYLKELNMVSFNTQLESKLCSHILKEFILNLMSKYMKTKTNHKINIDDKTMLVLHFIMPQIQASTNDVYAEMLMSEIYQKIDQACLSI